MTDEEIKEWMLSGTFPPLLFGLAIQEQIALSLQYMHFERVRVEKVPHHPVFRVVARLGQLAPQELRPVKVALKKMCRDLGFSVKMSDIIADVSRGRLDAVFGLLPHNPAPVVIEDDGERVPDHLEQAA
jgi:hypothetical protein